MNFRPSYNLMKFFIAKGGEKKKTHPGLGNIVVQLVDTGNPCSAFTYLKVLEIFRTGYTKQNGSVGVSEIWNTGYTKQYLQKVLLQIFVQNGCKMAHQCCIHIEYSGVVCGVGKMKCEPSNGSLKQCVHTGFMLIFEVLVLRHVRIFFYPSKPLSLLVWIISFGPNQNLFYQLGLAQNLILHHFPILNIELHQIQRVRKWKNEQEYIRNRK